MVTNIQNKQYHFLQAAKRGTKHELLGTTTGNVTVEFPLCHIPSITRETISTTSKPENNALMGR